MSYSLTCLWVFPVITVLIQSSSLELEQEHKIQSLLDSLKKINPTECTENIASCMSVADSINSDPALKWAIATDPSITIQLFLPILPTLIQFPNLPNITLPEPVDPHDLSLQFYQFLATSPFNTVSFNARFIGSLFALKTIDEITAAPKKGQLHYISQQHIDDLVAPLTPRVDRKQSRRPFDFYTFYDPKYYRSPFEHWSSILQFHRELGRSNCSILAEILNENTASKLYLAENPEMAMNVLFPMILHYKDGYGNLSRFPDFTLSPTESVSVRNKTRSFAFYQMLASCGGDRQFDVRLFALKFMDNQYPKEQRELEGVSFRDITKVKVSVVGEGGFSTHSISV